VQKKKLGTGASKNTEDRAWLSHIAFFSRIEIAASSISATPRANFLDLREFQKSLTASAPLIEVCNLISAI
jgi:hypothetical protein